MRRKLLKIYPPSEPNMIMSMPETFRRVQVPRSACKFELKRHREAKLAAALTDGQCDGFIISNFWGESYGIQEGAYLTITKPGQMTCDHETIGSLFRDSCEEAEPIDLLLISGSKRTLLRIGTDVGKPEEIVKLKGSYRPPPLADAPKKNEATSCPPQGPTAPTRFDRMALGRSLMLGNELMRPFKVDDPVVGQGYQIPYLRQNSPLKMLGFETGDTIFGINGLQVLSPEDVLRFAASLMNGTGACVRWKKPTGAIYQRDFASK